MLDVKLTPAMIGYMLYLLEEEDRDNPYQVVTLRRSLQTQLEGAFI